MAPVDVELETLVSEPDALTTQSPPFACVCNSFFFLSCVELGKLVFETDASFRSICIIDASFRDALVM